jgi:transposase
MQFLEGLSDRQAADAVRGRIDWKYLIGLDLADPGFDHTVLSEFRTRLVEGQSEHLLFEILLTQLCEQGYLKERGRQRSDSTHILAMVHALNRVECVGETFRHALNTLAAVAPEWCLDHLSADWIERYDHRVEDYRLPNGEEARQALVLVIGADGSTLLEAIYAPDAPSWLREIPALQTLRRVWVQNYFWEESNQRWRSKDDLPPAARFISSPYDLDAVYNKKRTLLWVGYKMHFTETCDNDAPHLITHVETTKASVTDDAVTERIHEALKEKHLLPDKHIVDTGYLDAKLLVESWQNYGVDLLGPTRDDYHWQAREGKGFAAKHFAVDWQQQRVTCPQGKTSVSWTPLVNRYGTETIKVRFSTKDCQSCPCQQDCTRSQTKHPRRLISIHPEEQYHALRQARDRAATVDYKQEYAHRAGIEGTISQEVRTCEVRCSRYRGLPKTHLHHVLTATALNMLRLGMWLAEEPLAQTRHARFVRLYQSAA